MKSNDNIQNLHTYDLVIQDESVVYVFALETEHTFSPRAM